MSDSISLKPRLTQILSLRQVEPPIQEKIRVRYIDIVDSSDNVIMSLGDNSTIYDSSDRSIITIYDSVGNEVIELGYNSVCGILNIYGDNGSYHIDIKNLCSEWVDLGS